MNQVAVVACLFGLLIGCGGNEDAPPVMLPRCETPIAGTAITAREVGRVTGAALLATSPPADLRLFVLEQRGAIRIFSEDLLLPTPFLDVSAGIAAGGEQGLLGLAFHPDYARNGLFYIYYTTSTTNTVARCSVSATDRNVANPTCTPILVIPDFAGNHNGGMIEFGRDGLLYIGTGDGGGGGDPNRNAQSLVNGSPATASIALLGKILRIDVDTKAAGKEYGIPSGNPFAGGGGEPEIFMIGLRNPWRWSFDRETGDIWIGDVGQGEIEELDVIRPAAQRGANLGWSMYEGANCFRQPCDPAGKQMPQDSRTHNDGWISVIAGTTYRGTCYPDLVGWHFYTDYGAGGLFKARLNADDSVTLEEVPGTFPSNVSSLHHDARAEMYMTTTAGRIYHLEAAP